MSYKVIGQSISSSCTLCIVISKYNLIKIVRTFEVDNDTSSNIYIINDVIGAPMVDYKYQLKSYVQTIC